MQPRLGTQAGALYIHTYVHAERRITMETPPREPITMSRYIVCGIAAPQPAGKRSRATFHASSETCEVKYCTEGATSRRLKGKSLPRHAAYSVRLSSRIGIATLAYTMSFLRDRRDNLRIEGELERIPAFEREKGSRLCLRLVTGFSTPHGKCRYGETPV